MTPTATSDEFKQSVRQHQERVDQAILAGAKALWPSTVHTVDDVRTLVQTLEPADCICGGKVFIMQRKEPRSMVDIAIVSVIYQYRINVCRIHLDRAELTAAQVETARTLLADGTAPDEAITTARLLA